MDGAMLDEIVTTDEVSEFRIEDLFFSRTDKRGVIQAGNEVFYQVAKYEYAELLGAPHKTVRHPDMPKAVFWIMWDMLKRDEPIGAYVKNRAQDGSYYWVFAMTTPIEGGYLSVRQKPCTDNLGKIEALYSEVRHRELTQDVSAQESAEFLVERLGDLGWRSYPEFMTDVLIEETAARKSTLGIPSDGNTGEVSQLKDNAHQTLRIAQNVLDDFSTIAGFPVNMHIQASKLKASGKIFGSIADNYQRLSKRVENAMHDFIDARKNTTEIVDKGVFRLMVASVQSEMVRLFQRELDLIELNGDHRPDPKLDLGVETMILAEQSDLNRKLSIGGLNAISAEYKNFTRLINEMTGILSALSVTQFVGLVETARLDRDGETLKAMLQDVTNVQSQAQENLKKLEALNRDIATRVSKLSKALSRKV
jgi:aerotaxis receptor